MSVVTRAREQLRGLIRRTGFDVSRYPPHRPGYSLDTVLGALFDRAGVSEVIDVGARHGEYGTYLRQIGYRGRITSFEPVSTHLTSLRGRAAADGNWRVEPVALGRAAGTADLHVAESSDFSSFRAANDALAGQFPDGAKVARVETVEVARLADRFDALIPAGAAVLLKLDTQGWDLEVLAGAEGRLDRVTAIQSEVAIRPLYEGAPDYLESLTWLGARGFVPAGLFPVSYREDSGGMDPLVVLEADCVFTRR
ncbi:MAG: FkbM family methyltransferase [Myxococcota bacterium]